MICRMDFDMFFRILIFDPNWGFCIGYSLCLVGDIQNPLISRIFGVFCCGFLLRTTLKWFSEWILICFLRYYFLTQSEDFAWAIAFAWWLIFKMRSFLEYLEFLEHFFALNNSKLFEEWILTCFLNLSFWLKVRILHEL